MKKDKIRVENENFDEASIRSFLDYKSYDNADADFIVLKNAYQTMPLEVFESFLQMFDEAGKSVNAKDANGQTLPELMKDHASFSGYLKAIEAYA